MTTENTTDAPQVQLYAAMVAAKRSIKQIKKGGHNKAQDFWYRTYDDIVDAIEPALSNNGLIIIPETVDVERTACTTVNKYDKKTVYNVCNLTIRYTVVHESGQSVSMTMQGSGWDTGDKALTKAYTYARKTMLLQLFGYTDEDTTDPDGMSVGQVVAKNPEEDAKNVANVVTEASRQHQKAISAIEGCDDMEVQEAEKVKADAVNVYKGWGKRQYDRLSTHVLNAAVPDTENGPKFNGSVDDYLNHLRIEIESAAASS